MNVTALSPTEVEARVRRGTALVLDVREPREFGRGHVAGSVCVPLANLAKWGPRILEPETPLVLVGEPEELDSDDEHDGAERAETPPEEVVAALESLAQVGFGERVAGYLAGGYDAWAAGRYATGRLAHIGARAISDTLGPHGRLVDVRTPEEFTAGHIPGSENHPLDDVAALRAALHGNERPLLLICRVGNRSATAASLLLRDGTNSAGSLHNLIGGYNAWRNVCAQ